MPGDLVDFGALAARLAANLDDIRACLLMSRDGLTLGVFPQNQETYTREVWDRLRSIGDPERGFISVGDELWILARRGPYAGVVIAGPGATPGLLLDRLEFTLRSAEEMRLREGAAAQPRGEATRRPRTLLHRERGEAPRAPSPGPPVTEEPAPAAATDADLEATLDLSRDEPPAPEPEPDLSDPVRAALEFTARVRGVDVNGSDAPEAPGPDDAAEGPAPVAEEAAPPEAAAPAEEAAGEGADEAEEPQDDEASPPRRRDDVEVDPVALAREFANLISDPDEES